MPTRVYTLKYLDVYNYVVVENERPVIPNNTPPALARLIRKCWHSDPAKRPSFAQILDKHVLDDGKALLILYIYMGLTIFILLSQ